MSASASYADIARMLEDCAPGSTVRLATHSRVVKFSGKILPTSAKVRHHRTRVYPQDGPQPGNSRDCAQKHIPALGPKQKSAEDST